MAFTVLIAYDRRGRPAEFLTVDPDSTTVDGAPEAFVLLQSPADRFTGIEADEAQDVSEGESDVHCGEVEAAYILGPPAERDSRALLGAVKVDQKESGRALHVFVGAAGDIQ